MFLDDKPQGEVTEAPARTLKLSEAIRVGARLRPQCRGSLFRDGASCAIGAAFEARGGAYKERLVDSPKALAILPELYSRTGCYTPLGGEIYRSNDFHAMTREQIADWLEWQGL